MADLSDALHDAVASSVVEVCRRFLSFSNFIKITGSVSFDVDGRQV